MEDKLTSAEKYKLFCYLRLCSPQKGYELLKENGYANTYCDQGWFFARIMTNKWVNTYLTIPNARLASDDNFSWNSIPLETSKLFTVDDYYTVGYKKLTWLR